MATRFLDGALFFPFALLGCRGGASLVSAFRSLPEIFLERSIDGGPARQRAHAPFHAVGGGCLLRSGLCLPQDP